MEGEDILGIGETAFPVERRCRVEVEGREPQGRGRVPDRQAGAGRQGDRGKMFQRRGGLSVPGRGRRGVRQHGQQRVPGARHLGRNHLVGGIGAPENL